MVKKLSVLIVMCMLAGCGGGDDPVQVSRGVVDSVLPTHTSTQFVHVNPRLKVTIQGLDSVFENRADVGVGQEVPIRVTVTNTGSAPARDVMVYSILPDGVTTHMSNQRLLRSVGTLPPGAVKSMDFRLKPETSGKYTMWLTAHTRNREVSELKSFVIQARLAGLVLAKSPLHHEDPLVRAFDITVRNNGDGTAENVTLVDYIPSMVKYESATPAGEIAEDRLTWYLGDLKPNEYRLVNVRYRIQRSGKALSRSEARADGIASVRTALFMEWGGEPAAVAVTALRNIVKTGEATTVVVKVTNLSTRPLESVRPDVSIPPMFRVVDPNDPDTPTTLNIEPYPSLAPGESTEWTITIQGRSQGIASVDASLSVGGAGEPVSGSTSVSVRDTLTSAIVIDDDGEPIASMSANACDPLSLRFQIRNESTRNLSPAKLQLRLSDGLVGGNSRQQVSFVIRDLGAGESRTALIPLEAREAGDHKVEYELLDAADTSLHQGSVTVAIAKPKLQLGAIVKPDNAVVGATQTATVPVSNTGNGVATNVRVIVPLADGISFVSASEGGRLDGRDVTWHLPQLQPGETRKLGIIYSSEADSNAITRSNQPITAEADCCDPAALNPNDPLGLGL